MMFLNGTDGALRLRLNDRVGDCFYPISRNLLGYEKLRLIGSSKRVWGVEGTITVTINKAAIKVNRARPFGPMIGLNKIWVNFL